MLAGVPGQHVLEDARALALLRAAQHGLRPPPTSGTARRTCGTRRGARRLGSRADRVEEPERGLLPRRVLADALAPTAPSRRSRAGRCGRGRRCRGRASSGLRAPRGARPSGARRRRGLGPAAPPPRARAITSQARVEDGVDERVVAEVRPAVVHVEHGDVDRPRVLGGAGPPAARRARTRRSRTGRSPGSPSRRTAGRAAACSCSRGAWLRQVYRPVARASTAGRGQAGKPDEYPRAPGGVPGLPRRRAGSQTRGGPASEEVRWS